MAAYSLLGKKLVQVKRKKFGPIPEEMVPKVKAAAAGCFLSDYDYKDVINLVHKRWIRQRQLDRRTNFEPGIKTYDLFSFS